jgi:hypothetical protein
MNHLLESFMKTLSILRICSAAAICGNVYGQPKGTNWGPAVIGVQMSAVVSNSVVPIGSSLTIQTTLTNGWKNGIMVQVSSGNLNDYYVSLTGANGKMYDLSPEPSPRVAISLTMTGISAGGTYDRAINKVVGRDFSPGRYLLRVWRWFSFRQHGKSGPIDHQKVESNPVEIQIH